MTAETLATFEASLADLDVSLTRTSPADCEAVLADLARGPTVGVPLDGVAAGAALPDSAATDLTSSAVDDARTGITPAVMGVADYGSVLLESDVAGTEPVSLYPEFHVAVLRADDVVADMPAAFDRLGPRIREGRRSVIFATGPSATADMGALVVGAHGPKAVHVVLVEDESEDDTTDGGSDGGPADE